MTDPPVDPTPDPGPPTLRQLIDGQAANTAAIGSLANSLRVYRVMLAIFAVIAIALGYGGLQARWTFDRVTATFARVVAVSGPAAQARSAATLAQAIQQIEHCIINHDDHNTRGTPLDPACPEQ